MILGVYIFFKFQNNFKITWNQPKQFFLNQPYDKSNTQSFHSKALKGHGNFLATYPKQSQNH